MLVDEDIPATVKGELCMVVEEHKGPDNALTLVCCNTDKDTRDLF